MKITFIPHGYSPKPIGGLKVVYEYANRLVARGHEVTIAHPRRLPNLGLDRRTKLRLWLIGKVKWTHSPIAPEVLWYPIDSRIRMLHVPVPTPPYIPNSDAVVSTWWATAEYVANYPPEKGRKFYLVQE